MCWSFFVLWRMWIWGSRKDHSVCKPLRVVVFHTLQQTSIDHRQLHRGKLLFYLGAFRWFSCKSSMPYEEKCKVHSQVLLFYFGSLIYCTIWCKLCSMKQQNLKIVIWIKKIFSKRIKLGVAPATEFPRLPASWKVSIPQIITFWNGILMLHKVPPSLQFIWRAIFWMIERFLASLARVLALMT